MVQIVKSCLASNRRPLDMAADLFAGGDIYLPANSDAAEAGFL
jgi:hypothetical protein